MALGLEQHLADYLLGLHRGDWTKSYNRECLALWREKYGDQVVSKVEKLVRDRWRK